MNSKIALFLLLLLSSCSSEEKPRNHTKQKTETKFVKRKVVFQIIQSTICEIVSSETTKFHDPTLFVHARHVLLDSTLAKELISKGASSALYSAVYPKKSFESFNTLALPDCTTFKIMHLIPVTTKELENMIGGLLISQMTFTQDKKGACFVYEFEQTGKKHKGKIGYVEVMYKNDSWVITKRFEINKEKHRLIG